MIAKLRDMKIASINDLLVRISAANATAKRPKLWPSAVFGQASCHDICTRIGWIF